MSAVYPRVCGGTRSTRSRMSPMKGLSPRVRGNLVKGWFGGKASRSIPACAGEPSRPSGSFERSSVYPRVCGGTTGQSGAIHIGGGLSPRVRGNPKREEARSKLVGSIPACAGEPYQSV